MVGVVVVPVGIVVVGLVVVGVVVGDSIRAILGGGGKAARGALGLEAGLGFSWLGLGLGGRVGLRVIRVTSVGLTIYPG